MTRLRSLAAALAIGTSALATRPADAQRAPVDTSPSCPLALAEGDFTRALARMRALPATP